jgi:hypothetical protein
MTPDELRIAAFLRRLADNYEARAARRPFSFDRMRAELLRGIAVAIEEGKHR